jgi:DUF917 family protein
VDAVAFMPDGGKVLVEGEAQDIVRRVREGDPTKGWQGDPNMRVVLQPYEGLRSNQVTYLFEFWTTDAHGDLYLAMQSPTCGPEVIERLVAGDTTRRDVIGEAIERQRKAQADAKKTLLERLDECADKLGFALQGDNAAHFGGKGRLIPVQGRKP